MRYEPHQSLIAPARLKPSPLRLGVGIMMMITVWLLLGHLMWSVIYAVLPPETSAQLLSTLDEASTPGGVIANLLLFGLLIVALSVPLRVLHQRDLISLIGPVALAVMQFWRVLRVLALLFLVTFLLPMPEGFNPDANLAFSTWLKLLPLTCLALLIQTSAEELAFRGYLQSQLAARFDSPLIWIGLPSLLFGALHFDPSLPLTNALVITLWAVAFGVVAADLTARSGTLAPAIVLHLVNNFSAIAVSSPVGYFDGLALFTYPFSFEDGDALLIWAPMDLLLLFCGWLAARIALRR